MNPTLLIISADICTFVLIILALTKLTALVFKRKDILWLKHCLKRYSKFICSVSLYLLRITKIEGKFKITHAKHSNNSFANSYFPHSQKTTAVSSPPLGESRVVCKCIFWQHDAQCFVQWMPGGQSHYRIFGNYQF